MTTQKPIPGKTPTRKQLDAVLIQLRSQRPSDVWRGMDQVRQWLLEEPENREVYGLLLDAVDVNRDLREQVRALLFEMIQRESTSANEAMAKLPSGVQDFSTDADDAYYAGEYERAIQLYRQVLRLDPDNAHAKDHIAKAEIKRITGETASGLPRAAEQYYRRARSFIAAREVVTAMNLLSAAIEAARAKGMNFPEAEEALNNMNNLLLADDFKQKAKLALENEHWQDALELYNKSLTLDPTNEVVKKEADCLQKLIEAEKLLRNGGLSKLFAPLTKWQSTVNSARLFMKPNNTLIKYVENQINQIRLLRGIGIGISVVAIIIISLLSWGRIQEFFEPTPIPTNAPTLTVSIPTDTPREPASTATQALQSTNTLTSTIMPTDTPTDTPMSTPTQATLGTGYINKAQASVWGAPNANLQGTLGLYQPLILLQKDEVGGSIWYLCSWEKDGSNYEGWILADNITFGPPPTPRP